MNGEQITDEKIKERLTLFLLQFEAMVLCKNGIATKMPDEEDCIKAYQNRTEIYNSVNNIFQFIKHRKDTEKGGNDDNPV